MIGALSCFEDFYSDACLTYAVTCFKILTYVLPNYDF